MVNFSTIVGMIVIIFSEQVAIMKKLVIVGV